MAILSVAVVTLIQLSSQGLRLLRLSDDHQEAVLLADRIARAAGRAAEGVEAGQEGPFQWERRIALVPVPEELTPGAGPQPRLYSLSVAVRWGGNRTLEIASLRAVAPEDGAEAMTPVTRARAGLHPASSWCWRSASWPPCSSSCSGGLRVGLAAWQRGEERAATARARAEPGASCSSARWPAPSRTGSRPSGAASRRASSSTAGRIA